MKTLPKVIIIIVNWNGLVNTLECLNSLYRINYSNFNIVIVDNGSKKAEAEKIKNAYPKIKLIKNKKNLGFAKACNQGIRYASKKDSDYFLLINNDMVVNKDFLQILINYQIKHQKTVLSPLILNYKNDIIQNAGGKINYLFASTQNILKGTNVNFVKKIIKPDFLNGGCILIKKEILEKVGLLDEDYFAYWEDVDWSTKAKKNNFQLAVLPKSFVWHKHSESTKGKGYDFKSYLLGRGTSLFAKKNLPIFLKIFWMFAAPTLGFVARIYNARTFSAGLCFWQGFFSEMAGKKN